ncbi:hypothetical protein L211DRAFT_863926 [Terfezia boudieri ATCC MYA-4762]|uniref:Uncharacterized protein n=1 Tax=Terfezia boudieri ATCC MYA-4762 TaxID=1051890 RepID=A0A3N4LCI6_9PEZI|nr:hypothetical protein L211DRAFT_863926 [Terfezia boudieri ATCC MYA-4762]
MDSDLEAFSHYPADGRANIEGSKSNITMNPLLPQASYPCSNLFGTSSLKLRRTKGLIGYTFMVWDLYPFVLLRIFVLYESSLGYLHYSLTDVLPQLNSLPNNVFNSNLPAKDINARSWIVKFMVFHWHRSSYLFYTFYIFLKYQTRVKLNRVFFLC